MRCAPASRLKHLLSFLRRLRPACIVNNLIRCIAVNIDADSVSQYRITIGYSAFPSGKYAICIVFVPTCVRNNCFRYRSREWFNSAIFF